MIDFIKKYICGTCVGDSVINFIRMQGIDEMYYNIFIRKQYRFDVQNPNEQMKHAREYFAENQAQIEKNLTYLADDESREIYKKAIEYRKTHNQKERPRQSKDIYFEKDIIRMDDNEVFLDCGAFIGDTLKKFLKKTGGKYKKVVCFEIDDYNYKMLLKQCRDKRVIPIKGGVWNKNTSLGLLGNAGNGVKVTEEKATGEKSKVFAVDSLEECRNATFIKMDIEGSEMAALAGAEETIKRNHPKLAICLYHSDEDYLRIMEYIHGIVPEYSLYVRHYSRFAVETVLYAVDKGR